MADFTYDLSTDRGKVRFMIGDTVDLTAKQESLFDAEIDLILTTYSNLHQAAITACRRLMAQLRKKIAYSASGVSSSQDQKLRGLTDTLKELKAEARSQSSKVCYAGQINRDRVQDAKDDADFNQPSFSMGMDDNPGATSGGSDT